MQQARLAKWLKEATNLVVIEIGAGTAIPSARRNGEAQRTKLIRINPREPEVGQENAIGIAGGALETLQLLESRIASK